MAEDAVQPAEGQGDAQATDSGLYDLDSVAPEIKDQLVPHLKKIEGNATKKFQEAADYRKQWEPYEQIGLKDIPPETVSELLAFLQTAQNPEQFKDWWKAAGEERGLFEQESDLDLEEVDDLSPEKIQELIAQEIGPVKQQLEEQAQERAQKEAEAELGQAMDAIKGQNGDAFKENAEQVENAVWQLAFAYSEDSSLSSAEKVQKGFEDYKNLIGQGEAGLFKQKDNQPKPPEGPGGTSTAPEKVISFDDPRLKQQALERLKQAG